MNIRIFILAALLISFGACKNSHDHSHDDGHQHETVVEANKDEHANCNHEQEAEMKHKAEETHQHGEECNHDQVTEETHIHAEGEDCGHDKDQAHTQDQNTEHQHAESTEHQHGEECNHDQVTEDSHQHGEECDHTVQTTATDSQQDHQHAVESKQPQKSADGHDHTPSGASDAHNHGDVKFQITAYSNTFEVFAEADPFSIEKPSSILAHFTWLDNFKPLTIGTVKAVLKVGNEVVQDGKNQPLRDGIYMFKMEPKKIGNAQLSFIIETEGKVFRIETSKQKVFNTNDDAVHFAMAQEANALNATVFTKEQSWKIEFETQEAESLSFGKIIKTTALTKPCVAGEAIISATSNGIVDLQSHHITEGMQVKKGEKLFVISGNQLANNNSTVRFIEAKNNYERALSNYERAVELEKDKIVTTKELIEAKNEYENTKVIYENLQENFSSQGQIIKSPIDGYINNLQVGNGEYVEAGYPLMGITKNQRLVLNADIQQKYASILPQIYSATIRTVHNNQTYTLEELNGHILSYGKTTNANNYLIPIALEIDNTDDFVAGGFVELYLKYKSKCKSIVVPKTALLEEQGNFFVFVQVHPELFEKREVKIGASDGQDIEIKSGLQANERIVSTGAIMIKLAQSTGALDAHSGHVH